MAGKQKEGLTQRRNGATKKNLNGKGIEIIPPAEKMSLFHRSHAPALAVIHKC